MKTTTILMFSVLCIIPKLATADERLLYEFNNSDAARSWITVNDGVMGGRSRGSVKLSDDNKLVFYGNLSLQNNGGFASIRTQGENLALKPEETILLMVKGDGREYKFNVYTRRNLGGYSYRQSFQTVKDKWIEVELPVSKFVATWRGRVFPNEKLVPERVSGIGILLGDKKSGPFRLELEWIKVNTVDE